MNENEDRLDFHNIRFRIEGFSLWDNLIVGELMIRKHRLIAHLHFDWGVELCARSSRRRPRDRWCPEEVPGCCVQFRGEFFVRL